jgi:pyruvate/2-oxoglutarate dehydrogenase complex dihydrolipoamide dehydrogenase (E3) component
MSMSNYDLIANGDSPNEHSPGPFGGECSYGSCIPLKTLLRPGELVLAAVPGE